MGKLGYYSRKINFFIQETLRRKKWIKTQKGLGTDLNFILDPELKKKVLIAGKTIKEKGKNKMLSRIVVGITRGEIGWIPNNKRVASIYYIELTIGNVEVGDRLIKKMGLEKEAGALNALIKLY